MSGLLIYISDVISKIESCLLGFISLTAFFIRLLSIFLINLADVLSIFVWINCSREFKLELSFTLLNNLDYIPAKWLAIWLCPTLSSIWELNPFPLLLSFRISAKIHLFSSIRDSTNLSLAKMSLHLFSRLTAYLYCIFLVFMIEYSSPVLGFPAEVQRLNQNLDSLAYGST